MRRILTRLTAAAVPAAALLASVSCAVSVRRDIQALVEDSTSVSILLPHGDGLDIPETDTAFSSSDTLTVTDPDGRRVFFMKGGMDSSGTILAAEPLQEIVITARAKHIAERSGRIQTAFDINIPAGMINPEWQLRLVPLAVILNDTVRLDALHVTGSGYRESQIRGYRLYRRFVSSIISDSADLIYQELLETFIARNFPVIAAMKNDSSVVDTEVVEGLYGISIQEAREHFIKKLASWRNNRKKSRLQDKYRQFVKDPYIIRGLRLDTVVSDGSGGLEYAYIQEFQTKPGLRKIEVVLRGGIYRQGMRLFDVPVRDTLTFYVSSLSTLIDDCEKYVRKVIDRKVEFNTSAYISFPAGGCTVDGSYFDNSSELAHIKAVMEEMTEQKDFIADSLIITASCSPEGSYGNNRKLALKRASAISGYLGRTGFRYIERSKAEDWDGLRSLILSDTVLTDKDGILEVWKTASLDQREARLSTHPEYRYIKERLYPMLRKVNFDFYLHRRGMVKDTIQTTEPDTVYAAGLKALKEHNYTTAARLLGSYRDLNCALAFLAVEYNSSAAEILETLPPSGKRDYLLAIARSRCGDERRAVEHFLSAVRQDKYLAFRGNLDPEINRLLEKYDITIQ